MIDKVNRSLGDAEARIQSWNSVGRGWAVLWGFTGGALALIVKDVRKGLLVTLTVLAGSSALYSAIPKGSIGLRLGLLVLQWMKTGQEFFSTGGGGGFKRVSPISAIGGGLIVLCVIGVSVWTVHVYSKYSSTIKNN